MAKAVEGRRVAPVRHHGRLGQVADIQNDGDTVNIADVGAIGPFGKDVGIVHPKTRIELGGHTCGWSVTVPDTRARIPPPTHFLWLGRVADIDDAIELIVLRISGGEISRPAGHMHVLTVDKPQTMYTPRVRPRGIEMGNQPGGFRRGNIEEIKTRRLCTDIFCLISHRHDIAHDVQRIRPHLRVW